MNERNITIPSQGRELECYLAFPADRPSRRPTVVVVHEIFGTNEHIRDVARRLATEGYSAAAPNLFTGDLQRLLTPENVALAMQSLAHAPADLRRNPAKFADFAASEPPERRPLLEAFGKVGSPPVQESFARDLLAVTRALARLPEVDPHRIGAVGFCFGGAMVGRLATVDPELRAAVIFYGQNPPLAEVPQVRARVLGLYGGEDPGITGTVPDLAEAMRKSGKSFDYHVYDGARHAFFNDTRPSYHPSSAQDAWKRVLAFLASALGQDGP